jgi:peptidyl-prolyl cis-trans isomerase A (cyclophilin A)
MSDNEEAIVKCGTTKGDITMKFIREWSPMGYDRAVELYERHFFDGSHFFRAVPKFLVQFGISYSEDKELQALARRPISDDHKHDPPIEFHPGIISYAGSGPNSRTSQMFISYGSAPSLGRELWETPIGKVIEGMDVAEKFYSYGDMPPWGKGPVQGKIYNGPKYIEEGFPLIDKFLKCKVTRLNGSSTVGRELQGNVGDDEESPSGDSPEEGGESPDEGGESPDEGGDAGGDEDGDENGDRDSKDDGDENEDGDESDDGDAKAEENRVTAGHEKKTGIRSNNKKFFAVPQATLEKRELEGGVDSNSLYFPILVILAMVVLSVVARGRRKEL